MSARRCATCFRLLIALSISSLTLTACVTGEPTVETIIVEGERVVVTQIVEATPEPKPVDTFIRSFVTEPRFLTPNYEFDSFAYQALENLFDQLISYDANWKIVPDLAKSWEISDDGLTYTFHLVEGVKWHDGEPLTSEDVKWTIESARDYEGSYTAVRVEKVVSVDTPDDYTVVITLSDPSSGFLAKLAHVWSIRILPKHIYGDGDPIENPAYLEPIGSGAFKFVEWVKGEYFTFEANDEYFKGRPKIDRFISVFIPNFPTALAAMERGEINFAEIETLEDLGRLVRDPNLEVVYFPSSVLFLMQFNVTQPPFDDVNVRRAIAHAIDRDQISQLVYGGAYAPANHVWISYIEWVLNPSATQPEFDPAKAEELLDAAGYPRGPDGTRFSFKFDTPIILGLNDMGTVIQANLKDIGIDVELVTMDFSTFAEKAFERGDYEACIFGGYQGPDPSEMELYWKTGAFRNSGGYSSPRIDELFDEMDAAVTLKQRADAFKEMQGIIAEDLPRINLVEFTAIYVIDNNYRGLWMEKDSIEDGLTYSEFRNVFRVGD